MLHHSSELSVISWRAVLRHQLTGIILSQGRREASLHITSKGEGPFPDLGLPAYCLSAHLPSAYLPLALRSGPWASEAQEGDLRRTTKAKRDKDFADPAADIDLSAVQPIPAFHEALAQLRPPVI